MMKYTFILLVHDILERVLKKNCHLNCLGDIGTVSFILGCPSWMSGKAETRAEAGNWLQNSTFCTQPGEQAGQVGPLCSSGWIKVICEYLKAEFHLLICRKQLQCPHLQLWRAEAVSVIVVRERAQCADPEGLFRSGITEKLFPF